MKPRPRVTITDVADRIEQAAHTLRRLPKVTVRGFIGTWPPIVRETMEAYGWDEARVHPGPPSARHISEMDEALRWMLWLERDEVRIVWLRASGLRWKKIGFALGWSVRKLQYDWRVALMKIVHCLNDPAAKTALSGSREIHKG